MIDEKHMHRALQIHYHKYNVEENPIKGTYGLVWLLGSELGRTPERTRGLRETTTEIARLGTV